MIRGIQIFGVLFSIILFSLANRKYKLKEFTGKDYLLGIIISLGIFTTSVFPEVWDILILRVFTLKDTWIAIFISSNLILIAIFFYVLTLARENRRDIGEIVRGLAKLNHIPDNMDVKGKKTIQIVIPAYNEEEIIGEVLKKIPKKIGSHEIRILAVVDGSVDNTEKIVKQMNHSVTSHILNRGQGDALRTGFDIALEGDADIVVTMDADGQHRSEELENLVKPIIEGDADFVIGSRFLGDYERDSLERRIGIVSFTKLINLLSGTRITDCTSGFRAFNSKSLRKLELTEGRFNAPELIIDAARKGLRIKEVPITILKRRKGLTKKPRLGYAFGLTRTIIKTWLR